MNNTFYNEPLIVSKNFLRLFLLIIKQYKRELAGTKMLTVFSAALSLIFLILTGYSFIHLNDIDNEHRYLFFILLLALIISSSFCTYYCERMFQSINLTSTSAIMSRIWQHLLYLPLHRFNLYKSGELSHLITEYEASLTALISVTYSMISLSILFFILLATMFYCHATLSVLFIISYGLLLAVKITTYPKHINLKQLYSTTHGHHSHFLNETLLNIHKIKTSASEKTVFSKWFNFLLDNKKHHRALSDFEISIWLIEKIIPSCLIILIYFYIYFVDQSFNTATFLLFIICAGQSILLFDNLSTSISSYISLLSGYHRILPLLNEKPELNEKPSYNISILGDIELSHVIFKHPSTNQTILEDISLKIKSNQFIALVGESGAGKSSIFKLILGLEKPTSGTISFNQLNLDDLDIHTLRKQFGVVLQSTNLLPGTIFSNIAANATLTIDEAWELAYQVGLADDIHAMPMKMFTFLTDNAGDSISGGQKQKILIARALATKPKILLLDEATSALDNASQAYIYNHLKSLNITRFVIAHRHSTIIDADWIYYLENGRIIDQGTYPDLAKRYGW